MDDIDRRTGKPFVPKVTAETGRGMTGRQKAGIGLTALGGLGLAAVVPSCNELVSETGKLLNGGMEQRANDLADPDSITRAPPRIKLREAEVEPLPKIEAKPTIAERAAGDVRDENGSRER